MSKKTVQCFDCGGAFRPVKGDLQWEDHYAGGMVIPDLEYLKCDGCGEILLSPEAMEAVEAERARKIDQWLGNRPLKDFWDSNQVTKHLGLTRQALSKGVQVNNLIYKTRQLGKYCYLAESVRKFKRSGDGRLKLEYAEAIAKAPTTSRNQHPMPKA